MKIVCIGDSLTTCGGENGRFSDILQDRFPGHTFVNRGMGGESFVEALIRFETDVLAEQPDIVLLEYGACDWWRNERPYWAWAMDLEQMIVRLKHAGVKPVVLGVFDLYLDAAGKRTPKVYGIDERAIAYRELEAAAAAKHGCPYVANIQEKIIDRRCCWLDRNHPNEFGNRFVADTIEPVLEKLLGEKAQPLRKPTLATLRDFWFEALALAPDHLAAVDGSRRLTYAQAEALVCRLAAGLVSTTGALQPKVAVFLPNCLEYFLIYWAVARLGGSIVPLNTMLKEESLEGIFRNVKPDLLVLRGAVDREPLAALERAAIPAVARLDETATAPGLPWSALLRDEPPPLPPLAPDAPAIIMHTSGTTSTPKGAVMRHSDLMFNVMTTINAQQFSVKDVHLVVNPMFHCTALYSSLSTAAYTKTPVIISASTDPAHLMTLVARERITTFLSVPTVFQRLLELKDLKQYNAASLRLMAYAGSLMPVNTVLGLRDNFPQVELHNFFGLTETISMTHVLTGAEADTRPDSIGRLLPFVEARIVNPETLAERPAGEVGELLFAREEVIPGYYNQPGRLEESLVTIDGRQWFRTGDLAMIDAEGYFFIKGRSKDMIIVGGENVYSAEVEATLLSHPGVLEAAVKGVPASGVRKSLGELVQGFVVVRDKALSEQDLRGWCFQRLASFKVPVRILFLDALPRNPAGKVLKAQLPG